MILGIIFQLLIFTSLIFAQNIEPMGAHPPQIPLCKEPCEITGLELQNLIDTALEDPGVQFTKEALEEDGYYVLLDSASGWKQDKITYPDSVQPEATLILIPFGINNDPARAAFIAWGFSEGDTGYSAVEFYWGEECPLPNFEEVEDQTWLRGVSSSREGYNPPMAGLNFWKCWMAGAAGGCGGCLLGCMFTDGGYLHCLAICCGAGVIGAGIGCFVAAILE